MLLRHNEGAMARTHPTPPSNCPACRDELLITRLQCPACGTEVSGAFSSGRLVNLPEPHASLLELFIRVRGNVKDVERELGLSYPTVRARLDEAFAAAKPKLMPPSPLAEGASETAGTGEGRRATAGASVERAVVLDQLERGEITAADAIDLLRGLQQRRTTDA